MKLNFKALAILPLALGMMVSISACTEEETSESSAMEESAPAEDMASDEASEEVEEVEDPEEVVIVPEFTFTNTGEEEICELYVSPTDEDEWGPDQLGEATILPGEQYILQEIPAGEYDIKGIGCEGGEAQMTLDIQP